jgi:hypothetical protein
LWFPYFLEAALTPVANIPWDRKRRIIRFFLSPVLFHAFRLFIGGLFLYAGATKLADTAGFSEAIAAYRLLPDPLVPCAAMGLPMVEVVVGIGTLFSRRWAILGTLGMMILFLGVLGYGVASGLNIDCGCFSAPGAAKSQSAEAVPLLEIPSMNATGSESTVVLVEPDPAGSPPEEICSQKNAGPSKLRWAFFRDILLFLGVLYLVAWPDLRKKYLPEEKQCRV